MASQISVTTALMNWKLERFNRIFQQMKWRLILLIPE